MDHRITRNKQEPADAIAMITIRILRYLENLTYAWISWTSMKNNRLIHQHEWEKQIR